MPRFRRRFSPSFVVALIALIAAMGGTAVAQSGILITNPSQLGKAVVTHPKLAGDAVATGNLRDQAVSRRKQTNPHLRARVSSGGVTILGDQMQTERVETGRYRVTFDPRSTLGVANLDACAITVSPRLDFRDDGTSALRRLRAYVISAPGALDMDVFTLEDFKGLGSVAANASFDLILAC